MASRPKKALCVVCPVHLGDRFITIDCIVNHFIVCLSVCLSHAGNTCEDCLRRRPHVKLSCTQLPKIACWKLLETKPQSCIHVELT